MSADHSNELPQRSGTFRAVVQSGSTITSYLRAGSGRPVLLLARTRAPHLDILIDTLRTSFRLVVPELPEPPQPPCDWLTPFLDGLGLTEVAVIVEQEEAAALLDFAREEAHRVSRIVVLCLAEPAPIDSASVPRPLMAVSVTRPTDEVVHEVAGFLAGAPDQLNPRTG